jgi:hypothetical protein
MSVERAGKKGWFDKLNAPPFPGPLLRFVEEREE